MKTFIILGLLVGFVAVGCSTTSVLGEIHEHADFKVYLENKEYDFSKPKYMSNATRIASNFVHLHDMDGHVIHKHIGGVTLGEFFRSLGIKFNESCFILDDGTQYCSSADKQLKMYVNGKPNFDFDNYEFFDLDLILISFGNENENIIKEQLSSVTDKACIQSGKCPERGDPDDESTCLSAEGCIA